MMVQYISVCTLHPVQDRLLWHIDGPSHMAHVVWYGVWLIGATYHIQASYYCTKEVQRQ